MAITAAGAVEKYRTWVTGQIERGQLDLSELADHDLACWCPLDRSCHADVLIELAAAYVRDSESKR